MTHTDSRSLLRWLKAQRQTGKHWFWLTVLAASGSALLMLTQAWLLAGLLQALIIDKVPRQQLSASFLLFCGALVGRAVLTVVKEHSSFRYGQAIRRRIRGQLLAHLQQQGPLWLKRQPVGSWTTLVTEQIENLQDYYARYLPQMMLTGLIPLFILLTLFPVNWAAALILLLTAPLIPLFMILAGKGAAEASQRNFQALARLGGHFLDRLRGLPTLKLFDRGAAETAALREASGDFRRKTMAVLRQAFLSSAVLEFFAAISVALVAVYFGFAYLGKYDFGSYGRGITLFAGFLALILAPEFYLPLRELGTFYHAKAQATGAAEALVAALESHHDAARDHAVPRITLPTTAALQIDAREATLLSPDGVRLAGPLNFHIPAGARIAIVGPSGAGKSSLLNALAGFLPGEGSLTVNGCELRDLDVEDWRRHVSWVGQNPHLYSATLRDNLLPDGRQVSETHLQAVLEQSGVAEFLPLLPAGLETFLGENGARLSVGQAQRVAVARALLKPCQLLLFDEPDASLDRQHAASVMQALHTAARRQTTLLVTHHLIGLEQWDEIWVMQAGQIVQRGTLNALRAAEGPFTDLLRYAERL